MYFPESFMCCDESSYLLLFVIVQVDIVWTGATSPVQVVLPFSGQWEPFRV